MSLVIASLRHTTWFVLFLGLSTFGLGAQAWAAQRVVANARTGAEMDNNALRTTDPDLTRSDWLARYFLSFDTTWQLPRQSWFFSLSHGGKFFRNERDVDTLLTQVNLGGAWSLNRQWSLGLLTDVKDRTEQSSIQDYNRGGASSSIRFRPVPSFSAQARVGWRYFAYKPNARASTHGPLGGLTLGWNLGAQWRITGQYSLLQRRFETKSLVLSEDQIDGSSFVESTQNDRKDIFHSVGTSVSWQGPLLVNLQYGLGVNRSNSYGQDLVRHIVTLNMTVPLFWDFSWATRAQIQRTLYANPVLLDANFLVDEDNRNNLTLSLAYSLNDHWDIESRYSIYTQEFGATSDYSRQTIFFGLGYVFDSL